MNAEERAAHSGKMRGTKTYDECKALQAEHHQGHGSRAPRKRASHAAGATRNNGCDRMKARGFFK
jgi:hypothetical protein